MEGSQKTVIQKDLLVLTLLLPATRLKRPWCSLLPPLCSTFKAPISPLLQSGDGAHCMQLCCHLSPAGSTVFLLLLLFYFIFFI